VHQGVLEEGVTLTDAPIAGKEFFHGITRAIGGD
jgi:hypothetical protein